MKTVNSITMPHKSSDMYVIRDQMGLTDAN